VGPRAKTIIVGWDALNKYWQDMNKLLPSQYACADFGLARSVTVRSTCEEVGELCCLKETA
jgi:hypothetical protein